MAKNDKNTKAKKSNLLKEILDGSILTKDSVVKQLPFILFLVILALIYISNGFHDERISRQIVTLQKEIDNLKAKSISISSELNKLSDRSQMQKLIRENQIRLQEPNEPPKKIIVRGYKKQNDE